MVINEETNEIAANFVADLERHIKAVNVVRFSPNGEYLASGDDGKYFFLKDFLLPYYSFSNQKYFN